MRYSLPILRLIRESGVLLVTRIAGLLLSAIAVQLVADSVRAFVAGEGVSGGSARGTRTLPREREVRARLRRARGRTACRNQPVFDDP